ncbi:KfrA protein [Candidatus Burkholderia verschuerenii]|uniref:KfrA protein n=1 Tax=Candidatus Burkholderia verschuerenii TaxID=242163 RepID=A0A0L0MD15_9BURK|nr:DNA-binding protein [Candidatus Burkholderia verschuerenii]KND60572.1 KfrA protein [Candidatus Burkholderia verschuerenii]
MAITRDAIWQVADALDAEGIKPTLAAVRKKVGGGSYTTIHEAMTEWKSRRQQAATPAADPAPPELADRAASMAGEIWTFARAAADLALAGERQQMEAERAELRAQAAEAVEVADSLTEENDRMKSDVAELAQLRQEHERTLAELKRKSGEEINRTMEKANRKDSEAMEARKSERAALDRAAHLEGQVDALKGQLADLTATLKPRAGGRQ